MARPQVVQDIDVGAVPREIGPVVRRGLQELAQRVAGLSEKGEGLGGRVLGIGERQQRVLDPPEVIGPEEDLGISDGDIRTFGSPGVSLGQPDPGGLPLAPIQGLDARRIKLVHAPGGGGDLGHDERPGYGRRRRDLEVLLRRDDLPALAVEQGDPGLVIARREFPEGLDVDHGRHLAGRLDFRRS